jgi:hypothetical protein
MRILSKFLFFAFLLFFNSAFANLASDAEKLFSWGEQKYPSYFSIGETEVVTKILNYKGHDWYYRYYPETKVYLAINELNKVYVLGGVFGRNLLYIGRLEDLLDVPSLAKPSLTTTPTITPNDTVEVEVNGEIGATVFVNGVDSGKTIGSNGKVKVTLDTSGDAGNKSFSISLKDDKGNESEALAFTVTKENTLNEGLIAHYEFEGNAKDSSGNGNNGIEHGGIKYVDGVIGKAFNAAVANKAHLQLKNTFNTNYLKSLSFWIYQYGKHNLDDSQILLSKHNFIFTTYDNKNDINHFCASFYIELPDKTAKSDRICSYYNDIPDDGNLTVYKNEEMDINRWNHITYIDDDKYMYIYMNGNLVAKRKRVHETYFSNNEPINIGYEDLIGSDFTYNDYLNSKIDDLRIYNRTLSEHEVKQLYKMRK